MAPQLAIIFLLFISTKNFNTYGISDTRTLSQNSSRRDSVTPGESNSIVNLQNLSNIEQKTTTPLNTDILLNNFTQIEAVPSIQVNLKSGTYKNINNGIEKFEYSNKFSSTIFSGQPMQKFDEPDLNLYESRDEIFYNKSLVEVKGNNLQKVFRQPSKKSAASKQREVTKEIESGENELVHEHRLFKDLFKKYNKDIRPVEKSGEVTKVFMELSLFDVLKLDTKNQILKTNSELILKWYDFHLKWDPRDYNNVTTLRVPHTKIWKPDVILYNTADTDYDASIMNTNAIVNSNGEIDMISHAIFVSVCNVDIQWYPFDEQHCKMSFASWSYDEGQISMILGPADISDYSQNPEFYLENFYAEHRHSFNPCCKNPMSAIEFHIQLQRRTKFSLFFYIVPGILINLCAVMVFSLPAESGEKIGLGINSLLAMIVFLMAMTENLPPTEKIPLAGVYYGVCLSIITMNISFSVFILNVNIAGKRSKTVPFWLIYVIVQLTKILGNRIPHVVKEKWGINEDKEFSHVTKVTPLNEKENRMMKKIISRDKVNLQDLNDTSVEDFGTLKDPFQRRAVHALELMARISYQQEDRCHKRTEKKHLEIEWKFISRVLDRLLFITFAIITFIFTITILTSSPYGEKFIYCPLPTEYGCKNMTEQQIFELAYKLAKESAQSHND